MAEVPGPTRHTPERFRLPSLPLPQATTFIYTHAYRKNLRPPPGHITLNSPEPPTDLKLFRDQVLEAQGARLMGQILLTPKASVMWLSVVSALVGVAIIGFLAFGSYTRRATITGQLVPKAGVIRVLTPRPAWCWRNTWPRDNS